MRKKQLDLVIPDEVVIQKILLIRGLKVMIDMDLAELYNVIIKRLNEQVRRNKKRFPKDFMFKLTRKEKEEVFANCDHLQKLKYSANLPFVLTEHGAVMAASILNSDQAIKMNIQIVRIFNKLRELLLTNKDILLKLVLIEKKVGDHDADIKSIFYHLRLLLKSPAKDRELIGFKTKK